MKRVVCAVFDSAAQTFGQPIFSPAIGVIVRSFGDEVNRDAPDNGFAQHPEDFELRYLADFDDESGRFSLPEEGIRVLARGKDVVRTGNV